MTADNPMPTKLYMPVPLHSKICGKKKHGDALVICWKHYEALGGKW